MFIQIRAISYTEDVEGGRRGYLSSRVRPAIKRGKSHGKNRPNIRGPLPAGPCAAFEILLFVPNSPLMTPSIPPVSAFPVPADQLKVDPLPISFSISSLPFSLLFPPLPRSALPYLLCYLYLAFAFPRKHIHNETHFKLSVSFCVN